MSNSIVSGDHSLEGSIDGLIQKVNLNSAFLGLAKNDHDLVEDMKKAIKYLYEQGKKRETLYVAVEHNTKYLTEICITADQ